MADTLDNLGGVSVSIINKGDGTYSLVRSDTGLNSALKLSVTETVGDPIINFDNSSSNDQQAAAASDASLTVDECVSRSTNVIDICMMVIRYL